MNGMTMIWVFVTNINCAAYVWKHKYHFATLKWRRQLKSAARKRMTYLLAMVNTCSMVVDGLASHDYETNYTWDSRIRLDLSTVSWCLHVSWWKTSNYARLWQNFTPILARLANITPKICLIRCQIWINIISLISRYVWSKTFNRHVKSQAR